MRANQNGRRAWRRAESDDDESATRVFSGLQRRELKDLETCRRVWEQELDPLAVCEAVRQSDLPDWLTSALLVLLTDGAYRGAPPLRKKMWAQRQRHAIDCERAANIAMLRTHPEMPQTWRVAYQLGEHLSSMDSDVPKVSAAGGKRSYEQVRQSLSAHPYRYHRAKPGMSGRVDKAWRYMLALMNEQIAGAKSRSPR